MDKLLDDYLCKKYPEIFIERKRPMAKSCMGRGFECGSGWFHLINQLCAQIQERINHRAGIIKLGYNTADEKIIPQVIALQVKEKFGTLHFYYTGGDQYIKALVDMSKHLSYSICENCGTMNENVGRTKGWIQSLCPDCAMEYKKKIVQDKKMLALWKKVRKNRSNPKRSWKDVDELTREDLGLKPKNRKKK